MAKPTTKNPINNPKAVWAFVTSPETSPPLIAVLMIVFPFKPN